MLEDVVNNKGNTKSSLTSDDDHVLLKKLLPGSWSPLIKPKFELITSPSTAEGLNLWNPNSLFTAVFGTLALFPSSATNVVSTENVLTLYSVDKESASLPNNAVFPALLNGSNREISA